MATKAVTSGSNGVSQVMNQAQPEAANAQGIRKFDVLVYPHAVCKFQFEVIKDRVFSGMPIADQDKYWCKWVATTEVINKPTIIHVTLPQSATSYGFVVHTNQAQNSSMYAPSFNSTAVEVFEDQPTSMSLEKVPRNRVIYHRADQVRDKYFKGALEQTITLTDASPTVKEEQKKA